MSGSSGLNRRRLLAGGAVAGSAAVVEALRPAAARTIQGELPWAPGVAYPPEVVEPGAYRFLTPDEAAFVEAAVARIIPTDELGPGAREAGCAFFIDSQLAGEYGRAQSWYMQGPWAEGSETQGYQLRLTPAQLYRAAIKAIDEHCRRSFDGKRFADLPADGQDKVLSGLERGEIKLDDDDADTFFELLLTNTVEGFFSDPVHGGNRDMVGWKLIGFPGARYDYRAFVGRHGERFPLPPVSLMGRGAWTGKG
jgi:gluconate 2-dehydrogenase gamma chain